MLSGKSLLRLAGVHDDLVKVIKDSDFGGQISEGLRSIEKQKENVRLGKSRTMLSRHLTGHAADIAMFEDDGDYCTDLAPYIAAAQKIQASAKKHNVRVIWGAIWDRALNEIDWPVTDEDVEAYVKRQVERNKAAGKEHPESGILIDGPHFELSKRVYP